MFNLGTQELLIIGGIVLVLFGGAKIPELMRGIGTGIREFKQAVDPNAPKNDTKTNDIKNKDESTK